MGTELIQWLSSLPQTIPSEVATAFAGTVFGAIFLRGNTRRQEMARLQAGHMDEVAQELLEAGVITQLEYCKARNYNKIAEKADEYYAQRGYTLKPAEEYDADWFFRFYEAASEISNEDMQDIWAKILAGEINEPTSYSLRTLEVLRNMGKKEAVAFSKVFNHSICIANKLFLPNYDSYLEQSGISFSDVLYLDEMGILNSSATLTLELPLDDHPKFLVHNDNVLLVLRTADNKEQKISVRQYPFTVVGCELASLQERILSDADILALGRALNAKLNRKERKIDIKVQKIVNWSDEKIDVENENLLENNNEGENAIE